MAQCVVLFRRIRVQGDGHHVKPPRKLRGDVPAVDDAAGAVGVHAGENLGAVGFHLVDD